MTMIPAKTAEPIEMPFGMWTWMDARNYVLDGIHILKQVWALLRGMMLGFSRPLLSTVSSGTDVRISLHDVNQRSDWLATQAVECHIKFCQ